jgi:hypothetical protein
MAQTLPTGGSCSPNSEDPIINRVYANVSDPDDSLNSLTVTYTMTWPDGTTDPATMTVGDGIFTGPQFQSDFSTARANGGTVSIVVSASDPHGNKATPYRLSFTLDSCNVGTTS